MDTREWLTVAENFVYTPLFSFKTETVYVMGRGDIVFYDWDVQYYNTKLTGRARSVRQAYRHARRAVRRERRMWHFLNPPK